MSSCDAGQRQELQLAVSQRSQGSATDRFTTIPYPDHPSAFTFSTMPIRCMGYSALCHKVGFVLEAFSQGWANVSVLSTRNTGWAKLYVLEVLLLALPHPVNIVQFYYWCCWLSGEFASMGHDDPSLRKLPCIHIKVTCHCLRLMSRLMVYTACVLPRSCPNLLVHRLHKQESGNHHFYRGQKKTETPIASWGAYSWNMQSL